MSEMIRIYKQFQKIFQNSIKSLKNNNTKANIFMRIILANVDYEACCVKKARILCRSSFLTLSGTKAAIKTHWWVAFLQHLLFFTGKYDRNLFYEALQHYCTYTYICFLSDMLLFWTVHMHWDQRCGMQWLFSSKKFLFYIHIAIALFFNHLIYDDKLCSHCFLRL